MAGKVTIIEPTIQIGTGENINTTKKKKVAAYARVSTDHDEQLQSYEAQVEYYSNFIQNNTNWEYVGVYADEGITGTNTKRREGFKRMVNDAKTGKIDIILTKSISRFARNTVDTLSTVRELKALGVEVRFEKENIQTFDPKCEVMLTIMSSLAQEESRSISENVQWGKRKCMMDGKVELPYKSFLGYRKGKNGKPEIIPEEAEIVKRIYRRYLEGAAMRVIAAELDADGVKSPRGGTHWSINTVRSILSNEKYVGDALLQKTITVDYLSKQRKKNEGELAQYYVTNSHPAIIDKDIFAFTQYELKRRGKIMNRIYSRSALSTRLICGRCGGFYGHLKKIKNERSIDKWACLNRRLRKGSCDAPGLQQGEVYKAFEEALKIAIKEAPQFVLNEEKEAKRRQELETRRDKAKQAIEKAAEILEQQIRYNARNVQSQEDFLAERKRLEDKLEQKKEALELIEDDIARHTAMKVKNKIFMETIQDLPEEIVFSDVLFVKTVEQAVVSDEDEENHVIVFHFVNGDKVTIKWKRNRGGRRKQWEA